MEYDTQEQKEKKALTFSDLSISLLYHMAKEASHDDETEMSS